MRGYWKTYLDFRREDEGAGIYVSPSLMGAAFAHLGEMDKAFDLLKRGIEEHDEDSLEVKVNPTFDPMRSDPRFTEMLRMLNLSP